MRRLRAERGQSSVELVALLPLTLVLGLAILALLSARSAAGQAAAAAQAGAMAVLQDADPAAAARAALPAGARKHATIHVHGRRISVTVRPATEPGILRGRLTSTASADAGPEPRR
jgi:hypothetical protein